MSTDTRPYVVLVTGSRDWEDDITIEGDLENLSQVFTNLVVRHGACPYGADNIASVICKEYKIEEDAMPADWSLGKRAGFVRNSEMVNKFPKPQLCIAYLMPCNKPNCKIEGFHFSHGAEMCAGLAHKAGIYVLRREIRE